MERKRHQVDWLVRGFLLFYLLTFLPFNLNAQQRFFNLTADDVRIDSVLPVFTCSLPLHDNFADSTYTVDIAYPEFIDMSDNDISKCRKLCQQPLSELPRVFSNVVVERKKGALEVIFVPLVFRDGKYQKLVSFMLDVKAAAKSQSIRTRRMPTRAGTDGGRYADHSILATGRWAKISVPSTGIYQLTDELIRKAGFSDLSKVHVYGYGGHLQAEKLDGEELAALDDLKEVPLCLVGGKRLFHAKGPVSYSSNDDTERTRNPYSNYGYYFLTESDEEPLAVDADTFKDSFYPSANDYHSLHEVDNYAWFEGGRNLFEDDPINNGSSKDYTLTAPNSGRRKIAVYISAGKSSKAQILINGTEVGTLSVSLSSSSPMTEV